MATILVTGVGGPAGRAVAHMLIARGHTVVGVDMQPGALEGGIRHIVPAAGTPQFMGELREIARAHAVDLIIPTVSEELPLLATFRLMLGELPVVIASSGAVAMANDKYLTYQRLTSDGVATPRSVLPSAVRTSRAVAQAVGWPCLSKPRVGRGGRGVRVYTEASPLAITTLDDRSILQEFVPGAEYAPNVYMRGDGSAVVVVLEKTGLRDGIVGNALGVRRVESRAIGALAVDAARSLGLSGPVDIDIRCRADGTPVVLEVNARFGANGASAPEVLDALLIERLSDARQRVYGRR